MKNLKLTKFILMNEEFYNLLTVKEKEMISNLDEYDNNLTVSHNNIFDEDGSELVSNENKYLYIGRKDNKKYFYLINTYNYNNYLYVDLTNGHIVCQVECQNKQCRKYIKTIKNKPKEYHHYNFMNTLL